MSLKLLDVNVLLALAWPSHVHHAWARRWFDRHMNKGWATCPITQSGFVRISSNSKFTEDAVTPAEARAVLRQITEQGRHTFWEDSISWLDNRFLASVLMSGHRQVTDVYLLGLAMKNGGCLATLDQGLKSVWSANSAAMKSLDTIPVG